MKRRRFRRTARHLAALLALGLAVIPLRRSHARPVDVGAELAAGTVEVAGSPVDIGTLSSVFDGDTGTLARSAAVNPMTVTLTFTSERRLSGSGVWFLAGDNRWRIETAASLADLDAQTGSFRVAFDWLTAGEGAWSERTLASPVTCRVVRLRLQRLTGDNYVHLSEWRLEAPIESLAVTDVQKLASGTELTWASNAGDWYALESSTDLRTWSGRGSQKATASRTAMAVSETSLAGVFYRVRAITPEDRPNVVKRVLVVSINPILESRGGRRLNDVMGWGSAAALNAGYLADLGEVSGHYVQWQVAKSVEIDHWPRKLDGFAYDDASFLQAWSSGVFHSPDSVDYAALLDLPLSELDGKSIHGYVTDGLADEVVCWAFPYSGFYESRMVGRGAYWCNAPGLERNSPLYVVMGLNPERGVAEALHSFGHRAESILSHVYGSWSGTATVNHLWDRFTRVGPTHGVAVAGCGNVHFPPNAVNDYDYGTITAVNSEADRWLTYPNLTGPVLPVSAATWGGPDYHRNFLKWWFSRFPKVSGRRIDPTNTTDNGKLNNWWGYVVDMNEYAESRR